MERHWKKLSLSICIGCITSLCAPTYASNYKLEFQSASTLADGGDAAVINDASTNWYNSAGIVYLPQQLVLSAIQGYNVAKFSGTATTPGQSFIYTQSGNATSYQSPLLPGLHYVKPINTRLSFGLTAAPAWGLGQNWGESTSIVRYNMTKLYTKSVDISPSLAWKINDKWSIGAGPDFNYFTLQFTSKGLLEPSISTIAPNNDAVSHISAQQWGFGGHVGVMFVPTETTRIGLNYRSKLSARLLGDSGLSVAGGYSFSNRQFQYYTLFPATTSLSLYHDLNQQWALMGTITYDQWGSLAYNKARNYQSIPLPSNPLGTVNVADPLKYNNTFDYAVGTHYKYNNNWLLRGALRFLGSPTHTTTRNITAPDAPKLAAVIGGRYTINSQLACDLVYTHIFWKKTYINNTNLVTGTNTDGSVTTSTDMAGAQLVWSI